MHEAEWLHRDKRPILAHGFGYSNSTFTRAHSVPQEQLPCPTLLMNLPRLNHRATHSQSACMKPLHKGLTYNTMFWLTFHHHCALMWTFGELNVCLRKHKFWNYGSHSNCSQGQNQSYDLFSHSQSHLLTFTQNDNTPEIIFHFLFGMKTELSCPLVHSPHA